MEAKLLQTAASLRTFFVLVISPEALKSLVAFLGYWFSPEPINILPVPCLRRSEVSRRSVVSAHSVVLIFVPPNKNGYAPTKLDWNQCPTVERVPGKVSGVWLFKGTRVPVKALFENLEDGAGVDDFLRWFPGVKREQVLAVLEFAEQSLTVA